jgi:hypothetical protein
LTEQRTYVAGLNPPKPNIAAPAGTGQQTSDKTTTTKTGPAQATAPASPEGGQTTGAAPSKK